MTHKPWRTIWILIAAAICFAIAFLISVDWLIHSGNVAALAFMGALLFVIAHISDLSP